MLSLRPYWPAALAFAAVAACNDGTTRPNPGISLGESFAVSGAQSVKLEPGDSRGTYVAVVVNTGTTAGVDESYSLRGNGLLAFATPDRLPVPQSSASRIGDPSIPAFDRAFESRLRDRERSELSPRMAQARSAMATPDVGMIPAPRRAALPATVQLGDMVTVNVNGVQTCSNPIYHRARVVAVGTHSIILADSLNPSGGFTSADYARFAARFDTLVYPLDVNAFGEPTDIDKNGKIALIFTLEVNRLTPSGSSVYVGGFTFSRDLFPVTATARAQACPTSNEGEFFYLLAPDPLGQVNGNRRTAGFVDTSTTAVIAHEFEHLINASRRLYVNNAPDFEEKWLDEGLAHIAEELLFYHEAGLTPRVNVDAPKLSAAPGRLSAFNLDMTGGGNSTRYRSYLFKPSRSSPYAADDSLETRGAAWDFLRYLADQAASTDGNIFFRLANGPAIGMENLQNVFGKDTPTQIRDWATSHAVDDVVMTSSRKLQQPSWNWHNLYPALFGGSYPLQMPQMADGSTYSASVIAGGAAYYQFRVESGTSATLTLGGASRAGGSHVQLVVVRVE